MNRQGGMALCCHLPLPMGPGAHRELALFSGHPICDAGAVKPWPGTFAVHSGDLVPGTRRPSALEWCFCRMGDGQ